MTITFENDKDVIVYALERIITFSRENQYLFVANCVWWIAGIIGLDNGLVIYIDNLISRKERTIRDISTTPRDIARDISVESADLLIPFAPETNLRVTLRKTRQGKVNPLPQSKKQLKRARQEKARQEKDNPLPQSKHQLKRDRNKESRILKQQFK